MKAVASHRRQTNRRAIYISVRGEVNFQKDLRSIRRFYRDLRRIPRALSNLKNRQLRISEWHSAPIREMSSRPLFCEVRNAENPLQIPLVFYCQGSFLALTKYMTHAPELWICAGLATGPNQRGFYCSCF